MQTRMCLLNYNFLRIRFNVQHNILFIYEKVYGIAILIVVFGSVVVGARLTDFWNHTVFQNNFFDLKFAYIYVGKFWPGLAVSNYFALFVALSFALLLTVFILVASYLLAKQKPYYQKLSPYECGFDPFNDARQTFDVKFFLVAILFIAFDIELLFLIPWTVSAPSLDLLGFWSMMEFLCEAALAVYYIILLRTI